MLQTWVWSLSWEISWRGKWQPLQHSCLENPMDRGTWRTKVHGVAEWNTTEQLSTHINLILGRCLILKHKGRDFKREYRKPFVTRGPVSIYSPSISNNTQNLPQLSYDSKSIGYIPSSRGMAHDLDLMKEKNATSWPTKLVQWWAQVPIKNKAMMGTCWEARRGSTFSS